VPPAIEMRGVSKRFGMTLANDRINLTAWFGEVHALIGENGAGKSTLMSILAGLYRPDAGTLAIAEKPVQLRSPADAIRYGVGMVYQHFMLVDTFTVAENVLLGEPGGGTLNIERVVHRLTRISEQYGLDVNPGAPVWQLSVGEQQRVEILRLLDRGSRILVLDEPTAVLTPQEAENLMRTLRALAADGFCVIIISHKLDEVLAVADRITVLRRGRVIASLLPGETDRRSLARMMVGRELAALVERPTDEPHETVTPGSVALAVRDLRADGDNGLPALRGIDLEVRAGETLGVAGVAGNGQRELAETITGLRPATGGAVMIGQRNLTNRSPREIARHGVAHIPEDRIATGLIPGLPVTANAILRRYRRPPIARGPMLSPGEAAAFTDHVITAYDVACPGGGAKLKVLSGGNQQKLLLGRELEGEPAVIVAVHPTRGVDVGATETIHAMLRAQRAGGAATLLISEDLDELLALADRIAVLFEGGIVGTVPAASADPSQIGLLMAGVTSEKPNPAGISVV
jgi:simple sugar transport system ATP-binding protein